MCMVERKSSFQGHSSWCFIMGWKNARKEKYSGYQIYLKVRRCGQEGMPLKDALDEAVKECIDEHVLEESFGSAGMR